MFVVIISFAAIAVASSSSDGVMALNGAAYRELDILAIGAKKELLDTSITPGQQYNTKKVTLDFEGVTDSTSVGNFYSSNGIMFLSNAYGYVAKSAGGCCGRFSNEPSPKTAMSCYNTDRTQMLVRGIALRPFITIMYVYIFKVANI